jgi:uncharacterized protein
VTGLEAGVGWALAFGISLVTVPVGVSGAVFLLPVQLGVLHAPSPTVTPTNLVYNVVALPGALWRFRSRGLLRGRLVRLMLIGTLPGVVLGAVLRVTVLDGPHVFRILLAALLGALGGWLLLGSLGGPGGAGGGPSAPTSERAPSATWGIVSLSLAVGVVGGVYGIGGGSILGPVLVALGLSVQRVAPAALMTTFVTSIVGLATFAALALMGASGASPDWSTGLLLGSAGLVGGWVGVRLQAALPERTLRLVLGVVALALAAGYVLTAWLG